MNLPRLRKSKKLAVLSAVLFLVAGGLTFGFKHYASAWDPGATNCFPEGCFTAQLISSSRPGGANVDPGDLLTFHFRATVTGATAGRTILEFANIDRNTQNAYVESQSSGWVNSTDQAPASRPEGCINGRDDGSTDPTRYYHCGNNGESVWNTRAAGAFTQDLTFGVRIRAGASAGNDKVCVRFHVGYQNLPGGISDTRDLIQTQRNGGGSYSVDDARLDQPVRAVSGVLCYNINGYVAVVDPIPTPSVGFAACSNVRVSNPNPYLGEPVTITVQFENHSASTDWHTAPYTAGIAGNGQTVDKQHSGVLLETGASKPLSSRPEGQAPVAGDKLASINTVVAPYNWFTDRTFVVTNTNPATPVTTYNFGIRNDVTGAYFPTAGPYGSSLCAKSIQWQSVSLTASCTLTNVFNPGNIPLRLWFFGLEDGSVQSYPAPLYQGPWDTFNSFYPAVNLAPHVNYRIEARDWNTDAPLGGRASSSTGQCMGATCISASAISSEPGQSASIPYGYTLVSGFNGPRTFTEYNTRVSATAGITITNPVPPIDASPFAGGVGNLTSQDGPYTMIVNYQGDLTAELYYNGTPISSILGVSNCRSTLQPSTRPTMKVTNGDISTGGGFMYKDATGAIQPCNAIDAVRFKSPGSTGNGNVGGIRTFSNPAGFTGSGVDFAAYALGLIDGVASGPNGFYSDKPAGNYAGLYFANAGANLGTGTNLGGLLGGDPGNTTTVANAHCAPDYFDADFPGTTVKQAGPLYTSTDQVRITPGNVGPPGLSTNDGQYYVQPNTAGGYVEIGKTGPNTVGRGDHITIYVRGDVYISKNINYQDWSFDATDHTNDAPYLTVVARGNIHVDPSVTRLDGLFIAQPDPTDAATVLNTGKFSTCSIASAGTAHSVTAAEAKNCNSQLAINGAVIAQHFYPLRAFGTLWNDTGPAELINFNPAMVVAEPNFKPIDGGTLIDNSLEGLYSLPPVF